MLRDFFLGCVKLHILHHAGKEPVYGAALTEELQRHGYDLSPGTLYPVLHHLEKRGYLVSEKRVVSGKVRKYYTITAKGTEAMTAVQPKIRELVDELLEGYGPASITDESSDS